MIRGQVSRGVSTFSHYTVVLEENDDADLGFELRAPPVLVGRTIGTEDGRNHGTYPRSIDQDKADVMHPRG